MTQRQIMTDKLMKNPGTDHRISIEANPSRVVVTVGGKVIAVLEKRSGRLAASNNSS